MRVEQGERREGGERERERRERRKGRRKEREERGGVWRMGG